MPNHVKNVIKFKHLTTEDINFLLDTLCTPIKEEKTMCIDFEKIIPPPCSEEDCPAVYILKKDAHVSEMKDKPWFNWYNWCCDKWGTKWNAYDGYVKVGKTYLTLVFNTAWAPPEPIYERLAILNFEMEIRYADENLGSNCGKRLFSPEERWTVFPAEKMKDSYRFAVRLWENY